MDFKMDMLEKRFGSRPESVDKITDQQFVVPPDPQITGAQGSDVSFLGFDDPPIFNPVLVESLPPPTTREQANMSSGEAPSSFAKLDVSGILDIGPPGDVQKFVSDKSSGLTTPPSSAPSSNTAFEGFPSTSENIPVTSAPFMALQPGSGMMGQQRTLPFNAVSMGATPGNPGRPSNVPMGIGQAGAAARRVQRGGSSTPMGKKYDEFDEFFDGPAKQQGRQSKPTGLTPMAAPVGSTGAAAGPEPGYPAMAAPPSRANFPYGPQVNYGGPPGTSGGGAGMGGYTPPSFTPTPGFVLPDQAPPPPGGAEGASAASFISVQESVDASARLASRLNAGPAQAPVRKAAVPVPTMFIALGLLIFLISAMLYMGDIEEINFKLRQMYSPTETPLEKAEIAQAHLVGHSVHELSADGVSPVVEPPISPPSPSETESSATASDTNNKEEETMDKEAEIEESAETENDPASEMKELEAAAAGEETKEKAAVDVGADLNEAALSEAVPAAADEEAEEVEEDEADNEAREGKPDETEEALEVRDDAAAATVAGRARKAARRREATALKPTPKPAPKTTSKHVPKSAPKSNDRNDRNQRRGRKLLIDDREMEAERALESSDTPLDQRSNCHYPGCRE
mmetsp:Transcript_24229/g.33350  ORF Transcript_24229/g.33350 Transcript_24229/m.33350 type:complete len:627 (-) Transcript_24229:313-2193(-)|eukprot:CAMPEP_0196574590 /NCGR_PEP_ID=MMETSP1081-20130531/4284_1 /TAXON_ID=36882 /ORGANISM="Pyramimonas amylifera, Strain CCMP720" /LENGTH=626 /DNA_ID=CAMNT_0041892669 /DNA_START=32 /DNA_END=1912 /DNA_ORIENTATION=-